MFTPRQWSLERLLQMLSALLVCLAAGMIVQQLVLSSPMFATGEGRFLAAVIHVTFFNVGGFLCVAWLLKLEETSWGRGFGFGQRPGPAIGLGLAAAAVVTPAVMMLQGLLAKALTVEGEQPKLQEVVKTIESTVQLDQRFFYGLVAIVLAPVIEELLFRGIFYQAIKSRGYPRIALWGTSLMFALVHNNLLTFIPLTMLALVLVWLYERTGNLLASIVAHSGFNTVNFLLLMYREEIMQWLGPDG